MCRCPGNAAVFKTARNSATEIARSFTFQSHEIDNNVIVSQVKLCDLMMKMFGPSALSSLTDEIDRVVKSPYVISLKVGKGISYRCRVPAFTAPQSPLLEIHIQPCGFLCCMQMLSSLGDVTPTLDPHPLPLSLFLSFLPHA